MFSHLTLELETGLVFPFGKPFRFLSPFSFGLFVGGHGEGKEGSWKCWLGILFRISEKFFFFKGIMYTLEIWNNTEVLYTSYINACIEILILPFSCNHSHRFITFLRYLFLFSLFPCFHATILPYRLVDHLLFPN